MFPQRGLKYKPKFENQIPVWSILGSFLAISRVRFQVS
jgi:hypothetical protein